MRGDVDPIVAGGVGVDVAGQGRRTDDFPLGHALMRFGIGAEVIEDRPAQRRSYYLNWPNEHVPLHKQIRFNFIMHLISAEELIKC